CGVGAFQSRAVTGLDGPDVPRPAAEPTRLRRRPGPSADPSRHPQVRVRAGAVLDARHPAKSRLPAAPAAGRGRPGRLLRAVLPDPLPAGRRRVTVQFHAFEERATEYLLLVAAWADPAPPGDVF